MRVKSNAVWHSLPGVVAAYQPIAAPDPFAARQNVAHNGARFGVYTAMPGVAPTWSAATGWAFNGSNQFLQIALQAGDGWSMFVQFTGTTNAATDKVILGSSGNSAARFFIEASNSDRVAYCHQGYEFVSPGLLTGNLGVSGQQGYRNGIADGSGAISTDASAYDPLFNIGCLRNFGTNGLFWNGTIKACVFFSRTLSPAESWLASRQMAYCDVNPDWSAWSRRRRYYYAPPAAAAAFNPAWARNANTVINQVHP